MRMLESIGYTAWTTCEECGNDFPAGTYRCGRCGHVPNLLHRLASFAAAAFQKKGFMHPVRSNVAHPGLAEGALKFYQARKQRSERLIWIGLLAGAAGLIVWALNGSRPTDMDLKPPPVSSRALAAGTVVPFKPAGGNGVALNGVALNGVAASAVASSAVAANASPMQQADAALAVPGAVEFYRAMGSRNLWVAHRRLAAMANQGDASPQMQQMRADLTGREHQRDDLLHRAWHCRAIGDWQCVSANAAQASDVDASSVSARKLVAEAAQVGGK